MIEPSLSRSSAAHVRCIQHHQIAVSVGEPLCKQTGYHLERRELVVGQEVRHQMQHLSTQGTNRGSVRNLIKTQDEDEECTRMESYHAFETGLRLELAQAGQHRRGQRRVSQRVASDPGVLQHLLRRDAFLREITELSAKCGD